MKIQLTVCALSLVVIGSSAFEWKDVKSPMESPHYKKIIEKFMPDIVLDNNPNITRRISNGSLATSGQFPYQIYMFAVESLNADEASFCGGSLIDKRWVLTAAHCIDTAVRVYVFIGSTVLYLPSEVLPINVKMFDVTNKNNIIVHPNWNREMLSNDIGLVRLPSDAPIELSSIGLLKLPEGSDASRNLVGLEATVSGFGRFSDIIESISMVLYYVRLPVVENVVCSSVFGTAMLRESNICLSSIDRKSACSGDSGGPLTVTAIDNDNETVQVGIVSFGHISGCQLGHPQVFTRVSSYLNWIKETKEKSSATTLVNAFALSTIFAITLMAKQYWM